MDQATLFRGKPGKIMLAGAAFLLFVTIPYLFAHFRQGQRATTRGGSTEGGERKGLVEDSDWTETTQPKQVLSSLNRPMNSSAPGPRQPFEFRKFSATGRWRPCVTRRETPQEWSFTLPWKGWSFTTPSGSAAEWERCSRAIRFGRACLFSRW